MTLLVLPLGRKPHSPDPPPPEVVMTSCVGLPLLFSLLAQLQPVLEVVLPTSVNVPLPVIALVTFAVLYALPVTAPVLPDGGSPKLAIGALFQVTVDSLQVLDVVHKPRPLLLLDPAQHLKST